MMFVRGTFLVLAMFASVPSAACADPPTEQSVNEGFYKNFLTAVADAPSQDLNVYWLGRGFTAGGIRFTGPNVNSDYSLEVSGGAWGQLSGRIRDIRPQNHHL